MVNHKPQGELGVPKECISFTRLTAMFFIVRGSPGFVQTLYVQVFSSQLIVLGFRIRPLCNTASYTAAMVLLQERSIIFQSIVYNLVRLYHPYSKKGSIFFNFFIFFVFCLIRFMYFAYIYPRITIHSGFLPFSVVVSSIYKCFPLNLHFLFLR